MFNTTFVLMETLESIVYFCPTFQQQSILAKRNRKLNACSSFSLQISNGKFPILVFHLKLLAKVADSRLRHKSINPRLTYSICQPILTNQYGPSVLKQVTCRMSQPTTPSFDSHHL